MSKYTFDIVGQEAAMSFWEDSPHGTAFTKPDILGALSKKVDWWIASKGKEAFCMWPVCKPDGVNVGIPAFTYYVGPMWYSGLKTVPWHRWLTVTQAVYDGFIEQFVSRYGNIHASLSLGQYDVRVFDWWNYHEREKARFNIRPRYTACIVDLQLKTDNDIWKGFRSVRRREVKSNEAAALKRCDSLELGELTTLYADTMNRAGDMEVSADVFENLRRLFNFAQSGYGEVVAYKNPGTGEVLCVLLLLYAKETANEFLCVASNESRRTGIIAWLRYNSIRIARDQGMKTYDFNGANSPRRGDDKHSYGASPELYFELRYD